MFLIAADQHLLDQRADDYAAQFPELLLDPAKIKRAWREKPQAALIETGVKLARIKEMQKHMGREGVSEHQLVRLVAGNPTPINRPAQSFVEGFLNLNNALAEINMPRSWLITAAINYPELADTPGTQLALGLMDAAAHFHNKKQPHVGLRQALLINPPLLVALSSNDVDERNKLLRAMGGKIDPESKAKRPSKAEKELLAPPKPVPPEPIETTPDPKLLNPRVRLKKSNILARVDAANILPVQVLLPDAALKQTLVSVHATVKKTKRIGTKGLKRVLASAQTEAELKQLPARTRQALKQADAVRAKLGNSAGRYSFMIHAVGDGALAEQPAEITAANIKGLAEILAPVGMTVDRATKMANRTPDYFLTTPVNAQAHIDEVCGYFGGKLDATTYIKTMGQESRCSFLPLTKPPGFATATLEWVRETFEVGQDDLLKMVKYYPGVLAKSPEELSEKVSDLNERLKLLLLPEDAAQKIIGNDLTYLSRNTAEMGERFVTLAHGLHPYGFTAVDLLAAVVREPRTLFSRAEKILENTVPIFEQLQRAQQPTALYSAALRAQPMLLLCGANYVWDNFLIIRQSSEDGFMSTNRSKNRFESPTAHAFSMPLALAFAPEQLALRRVWARQVKGGGAVNSFLKTPVKVVQAELLARLGPQTDLNALAKTELEALGDKLGHSFNRQSAAPKPFGKKAKAEPAPT